MIFFESRGNDPTNSETEASALMSCMHIKSNVLVWWMPREDLPRQTLSCDYFFVHPPLPPLSNLYSPACKMMKTDFFLAFP